MATQRFTIEQMRAWSDLILNARKERGLTQAEVSEATGVAVRTLSSLERGPFPNMSLVDVVNLGKFYGISPNQIAEVLGLWDGEEAEGQTSLEEEVATAHMRDMLKNVPAEKKELALSLMRCTVQVLKESPA
jgi:transcriptional regulator with XRE-family HTH domain